MSHRTFPSPLSAFRPQSTVVHFWGVVAVWSLFALANPHSAFAQDPWEYKPYRIHVWLALE
ncbi:MAG: hypothetical protein ACKO38_07240, partial [Planctomycetota bacterium]